MTGDELRAARKHLGLTQAGLAVALGMAESDGRHIRKLEAGEHPIRGPIATAVRMMLERTSGAAKPTPELGSDE